MSDTLPPAPHSNEAPAKAFPSAAAPLEVWASLPTPHQPACAPYCLPSPWTSHTQQQGGGGAGGGDPVLCRLVSQWSQSLQEA